MENNKLFAVVYKDIPLELVESIKYFDTHIKYIQSYKALLNLFSKNPVDICILNKNHISESQLQYLKELSPDAIFLIIQNELVFSEGDSVFYMNPEMIENGLVREYFLTTILKMLKINRNKQEFMANIFHDINSPLNSVIGYLELLENGVFGELKKGQLKIISNITAIIDMIIEINDDYSLIQKIDSNITGANFIEFDIQKVVDEVLRALWIQADKKDLKIHKKIFNQNIMIKGDPLKIQRILINLITNAIKYSPEKGVIELGLGIEDHQMILSIKDQGPGIKKEKMNSIFSKYQQAENYKDDQGLGLGLYIAKKFVEFHDGQIWMKNNKDKGCTFFIMLPLFEKKSAHINR